MRAGAVCRQAPAGQPCEADDLCDATGACPPRYAPSGTTCGMPGTGECDLQDTCDGAGLCDTHVLPRGTSCGSPRNNPPCDLPDSCDGAGQCGANRLAQGSVCGNAPATECDGVDTCDAQGNCQLNYVARDTPCLSSTENDCNHADTCDGVGTCLANLEPEFTPCVRDANSGIDNTCTHPDTCDAAGVCQQRHEPSTTACDDGLDCTVGDHCNNGLCVKGAPDNDLCGPPDCRDLSVPGCCATWACDVNDTDPVSRGCKFTPLTAGSLACRPSRSSCDAPELCNGTKDCPADVARPSGYECAAPMCSATEARPRMTCNGMSFTCATQPSCDPFTCNATQSACRTTCTTSSQCLEAYYCDTRTGRCEPRTPGGEPCDDASVCATPFCVDGVCCDASCEGQCEACNVAGREGVCSPIPEGDDPVDYDNEACESDGTVCGGACDGVTTSECGYPPRATECSPAACDPTANEGVEASFCDGAGACAREEPVSCSPYACGSDACNGDCTVDGDCDAASYCQAGMCEPRRGDGEMCSRAGQCRSGFCADGVCCESSCDGQCEACDTSAGAGLCRAVTGAPAGDRPDCAGTDACQGACDGARRDACSFPGREVSCREAVCADGEATLGAVCDGRGACPAAERVDCPKGCEGVVCAGDECVVDADCPGSERCAAGRCVAPSGLGTSCARDGDCASGHCTDGVCCESACLGQCEACDVSASLGRCVAVPEGSAPHGARPACSSDGSECAGACDGVETRGCAYPTGNVCRDASCGTTNGRSVATLEARCVGNGRCPTLDEVRCPGACTADNSQCDGDCASDPNACPTGNHCSGGVCVPDEPDGGSCGRAVECASGFCVDGFCCNSACTGTCEACDVAGSLGACTAVSGASHGGRPACAGVGLCGAQCDGDSRDDCVFPDDATSCGPESCSNGAHSDGQRCDGAGVCEEGTVSACPAYACDGDRCGTGCDSDAECTGDNVCNGGTCRKNPLLDAVDRGSCGCLTPGGPASRPSGLVALAGLALAFVLLRRRSPRPA